MQIDIATMLYPDVKTRALYPSFDVKSSRLLCLIHLYSWEDTMI